MLAHAHSIQAIHRTQRDDGRPPAIPLLGKNRRWPSSNTPAYQSAQQPQVSTLANLRPLGSAASSTPCTPTTRPAPLGMVAASSPPLCVPRRPRSPPHALHMFLRPSPSSPASGAQSSSTPTFVSEAARPQCRRPEHYLAATHPALAVRTGGQASTRIIMALALEPAWLHGQQVPQMIWPITSSSSTTSSASSVEPPASASSSQLQPPRPRQHIHFMRSRAE